MNIKDFTFLEGEGKPKNCQNCQVELEPHVDHPGDETKPGELRKLFLARCHACGFKFCYQIAGH